MEPSRSGFAAYNPNSPSVRRIMKEYKEMKNDTSTLFRAAPLEDNLFEWHFTIRGPRDTDFEGGVYHGRILLPAEYPLKPPDIVFLTPSGRFEVEKKICLTISSHHEETWRPSWTIRTVLLALISFMPSRGDGAIASLDWPSEERKKLAKKSLGFMCDKCGSHNMTALPPEDVNETVSANDIPQELELRDAKSKPAQPASATPTSPLADSGSFPASSLRDSAAGVVGAPEQTSPASPPSTQTADHSHSPTPTAALATPYVEPQPMQHLPAMQQAAPLQQQYVVPNLAPLPPPVQTALFDDDDASDAKPQLSSYLDILITVLGVLMATVVLAKVVVSSISL